MQTIDTLIRAQWILPIAPHNTVLEDHALAIHDGRIVNIAPAEQAMQQWEANETISLPADHVLMPGFVNAHAHTPMNLLRGLADDLPLMEWLEKHIWPAEQAILNEESVKDGVNLAILEMIRTGTTCFCDHYFFHETIAQTAIDANMRACIGLFIGSVPTLWASSEEEYFAKAEATLKKGQPNSLITWALAPHSPYLVSENAFKKIKKLSDQFEVPIHIHLHETDNEINDNLKKCGKRPLEWLNDLGLLSPELIAVHMTQLTDEDIKLVQQKGVQVVHCPESNMKLASGFPPIYDLLKADVNVAIGTDGAASNNNLDMLGELQSAALLNKGSSKKATAVSAPEALKMATLNGAKAFGLDHEMGSLEPGKAADVIAIDLSHYMTQPVYNPMSTLAYTANGLQVSDVWIAGKRLLKNGEFTYLDHEAILDKAKYWAKKAMPFRSKASQI